MNPPMMEMIAGSSPNHNQATTIAITGSAYSRLEIELALLIDKAIAQVK